MSLSKLVLVGRSKNFFWFPQIARLSDGEAIAIVNTRPDWNPSTHTAAMMCFADGGLTWGTAYAISKDGIHWEILTESFVPGQDEADLFHDEERNLFILTFKQSGPYGE